MRLTLVSGIFLTLSFSSQTYASECLSGLSVDQDYGTALDCIKSVLEDKVNHPKPSGSAVPIGTIIAWYSVDEPVPTGWSICDGTNGTPDLRGKFLRGVGTMADAGNDPSGSETHSHTATVTDASQGNNSHQATCSQGCDDMWASLSNHNHLGSIGGSSHIPPNFKVVYLMKTR